MPYVNADFTRRPVGIDRHEAGGVLQFLLAWLKKPEFMVHHQWEPHGLAVWDNRSTQHYARADYWPYRRVNQRVTVDAPAGGADDGGRRGGGGPEAGDPGGAVNVSRRVLGGRPVR